MEGPDKEDVEIPSVAMFRNNLTALSQYRNLLFIAYTDNIHVYTPSFPGQTITSKPELVIELPRSRPGLRGYLDPTRPHAVNHLIIGDIGDEEVVVVACDDGDVISYTVRSICLAIDEGAKTFFEPDPFENRKLKRYRESGRANLVLPVADPHRTPGYRVLAAWFHENVGASAWGLATHKSSRVLAVSSNTKEINIFAPSLSPKLNNPFRSKHPSLESGERYMTCAPRDSTALRDRSHGRKFILRGHAANIPNIAFCDNNLDSDGNYLASTDIDGCTVVWDIRSGVRILETIGNAGTHTRGWAVACLDPRVSRLSEGPANTFGCACRVDESNTLIDNSEVGELVHNNSQWHPGFSALGSVPGVLPTGTAAPATVQATAITTADPDLDMDDQVEDETDEEMDEMDDLVDEDDEDDEDDLDDEDSLDEDEDADLMALGAAVTVGAALMVDPTLDAAEVGQLFSDEDIITDDDDSDLPDLEEVPMAEQTGQPAPEAEQEPSKNLSPSSGKDTGRFSDTTHAKTCPSFIDLPFNLLQTEEKDIHLFRDIRFDADLKRRPPDSSHSQVLCQQALNQRMPPGFHYLSQMERLNMIAQIPELGVVVIGNQVGRVGILTMTRWEAQKQSGYKIECILPFSSEESNGMRPRKPLMGMAVGPIQGHETALPHQSPKITAEHPRRFRLLMTYCDHTILSYEISRPEEEGDLIVA